ncbi:MAG: bifunctional metallophosphatase/5'-nucleotidase [Firmicutes bacterium]|nr:bifunctional metallophosphatase/5'-nucleotidase [Bacillota bacterium]
MSRNQFTWLSLILVLLLSLSAAAQGELVILHTNDLHGQSLAQIASLVEKERTLHPDLLLVDAGDLFSGTAVSFLFQGEAEQKAVLALGYDALALGNHDFDFGREVLEESLAKGVPWLSGNIFCAEGYFAPPFLLKEISGVRILLVGLTTAATPDMTLARNVEGLYFSDPRQALERILAEEEGNFDLCIVLSHLGYGEDLVLAAEVPGLTAIIGGHTHTKLDPAQVVGETIVAQTGSSGQYLGKIVISLEKDFPASGKLLRVEASTPRHPKIVKIDEHFARLAEEEMGQVVGYARRDYVQRGLGHLLTAALVDFSGADAALYNSGGVRAGLKAGPVTKADILAVEPFDNQAVVATIPGETFAELLKLRSQRRNDFFSGPKVVDLDREYTVATSNFLIENSSYAPLLSSGQINYLGLPVRQVLEYYLRDTVLERERAVSSF